MQIVQQRATEVPDVGSGLPTACILCAHNCGLEVDVEANKIVRIRADEKNPHSLGYSCNKGYTIGHYVSHIQRVEKPLRRTATGAYEAISWETAIEEIGSRLKAVAERYGGEAIALNGLGGQGNHLSIVYGLSFLSSFGSSWFFCTFAQEKTQHVLIDRWMMNAPTHAILHADAWKSKCLLVMGTNPLVSHRNERPTQLFNQLSKDPNRRVIVVDPRFTETAKRADVHLPIAPGGDPYFLMAMVKCILQEGLYRSDFLNQNTEGFPELCKLFDSVDVEEMATRCDLSVERIREVALDFAKSESSCVFYDLGIEQIPFSTLVSWLIRILLGITGNLAREGGNVFTPTFKAMTEKFEPPRTYRAPVSGIEGIPSLGSPLGMFSPNLLPEEIEAGNIHALVVEGANPLISYPDTRRYLAALRKLDLLVVIEPAFTETAREAHYVLPTPVGYEKWEWSNHNHRFPEIYVQLRRPVVQGPREALPEAEIYSRMVQAAGILKEPPAMLRLLSRRDPTKSARFKAALLLNGLIRWPRNKLKAIAHITFWAYRLAGRWLPSPSLSTIWLTCQLFAITRRTDALRTLGPEYRWKLPFTLGDELFQRILNSPHGVEVGRVDIENHFREMCRTKSGKVHLLPESMISELKRAVETHPHPDSEFPLNLCAGERQFWNANTLHRDPSWRKGKGPHFGAKIHSDVAQDLKVQDGEIIRLVTKTGSLEAPAIVTDSIRKDQVTLPNGYGMEYPDENGELKPVGGKINLLTDLDDRDPFTGIPHLKRIPCRVEKAGATS